jgi:hypothetical protein
MDAKTVPGQKGQPDKGDLRITGFENAWEMTKSPSPLKVPTNPLADENPCEVKSWDNNTDSGSMKTSNDINGGKGMQDGGGVG